MKRQEAVLLIESLVTTYHNRAYYIGILDEITDAKPFRAKVRITGVLEYPTQFNHNTNGTFLPEIFPCPFGKIIDVGSEIKKYAEDVPDYNQSVLHALDDYICKCKYHMESINAGQHSFYLFSYKNGEKLLGILERHKEIYKNRENN